MGVRTLIAFLAACASHASAVAQQPEADQDNLVVIYGMWPTDGDCTHANTTAVTLADLLQDKRTYADRCVSTVGWLDGRALLLDRDDTSRPYSNSNATAGSRRIGLYGPQTIMQKLSDAQSARVRVVGKLWDCEKLHGSNVIMVMGYCHYTGGPIIGLSQLHPIR